MIEVYSTNVAVASNTAIPLTTQTLRKGCTATLSGTSAIELNRTGVYMVSVDAVVTSATPGVATIQMFKNGVAQPQAITSETIVTADNLSAMGFETLVTVPNDNTCRCCDSPTVLTFVNTGVATTIDFNVVVTKVC